MNKKESDIVNPVVGDATYTAQYEIRTYTIKFYGFNNQIISSIEIKVGYEFTIPDFPEIQCYEATHWDKEVVNPPIESADYYAQYERIGYLITFLGYNNYVIDTQVVRIGENPNVPDIPIVDGITYTGNWIPEIERPATKDMTYTAEYILGTKVDYVTILQNENNIGFSTDLPWHNHTTVFVEIAGSNFYTEYSGSEPERYACLISTVDNPNEVWDYDNEIANDFSFGCSGYDKFVVAGDLYTRETQEEVSEDNYSDSITYIRMRTDGVYIVKGDLKSDGTIDYSNVMFGETIKTGHSATNLYTPIWIAPKTSVKQCITYYDIKMYTYAGGVNPHILVKHYIPWKDIDGVYCLREELTNTLHYPQIGSWSGTVRVHMVRFFGFDKVLLSKQYINTGYTLSIPNIPYVDGYEPNGWDKEIVETVTESVDYYALYQKSNNNSYISTFGAGGVNTEVYPTQDTWMEFEASNLSSSSGDVNIGISVNAEQGTWEKPNDDTDWRFFIYSFYGIYWDRGSTRSNKSYSNISNRLRITCKWNELSIYDVTKSESIYTDTTSGSGSIISGYPIWIEPMTDPSYSGDYHYIKIYEGDELIRHYVPHIDENGVYCFLEVISNKLCYPISGSYTGSVTFD